MKRYLLILIVICSLVLLCMFAWAGQRDSTDVKRGMVFYNGRELEPPFEFTGHGTDTLYLNGIPYAPVRRKKETHGPPVVVTELTRQQHELAVRAYKRSRTGKNYEERLSLYAETHRNSSLVDSVRIKGESVYIYWSDMRNYPNNYEVGILPREEPPTDSMKAAWRLEMHHQCEKFFWSYYNKGGLILFGVNYGPLKISAMGKRQMLDLMDKLARGDTLTSNEKMGTFLNNKGIYKALSEQLLPKGRK